MNNGNASYDKLLTMWRDEKKKREEAEGELTIIKGIGNNSPEMKSLQAQVEELKKELALVREDAQVEIMRRDQRIFQLEKLDKEHKDLNGRLQLELTRVKGGL
jgi:hypothetical protein